VLWFEPFYLANEGKFVAFIHQEKTENVLEAMQADPLGEESVTIGRVVNENPGKVLLKNKIGGHRLLEPLRGEQFPQIYWMKPLYRPPEGNFYSHVVQIKHR
jgi:hydrogenase expression/formation protein HypE